MTQYQTIFQAIDEALGDKIEAYYREGGCDGKKGRNEAIGNAAMAVQEALSAGTAYEFRDLRKPGYPVVGIGDYRDSLGWC